MPKTRFNYMNQISAQNAIYCVIIGAV